METSSQSAKTNDYARPSLPSDDIDPSWRNKAVDDDLSPASVTFSDFDGGAELDELPGYSVDPFKRANNHPNAPRSMITAIFQLLTPCRKQRSLADIRFNMIEIVILYTACVVGLATLTGALVFSDIRGCETMAAFGGHSRVFRIGMVIAALGIAPVWGFIAVYLSQRSPRSLSKLTIRVALWLGLISSVCLLGVAAVPVNYWTELHTFFSQLSFLCASVACLLFCIAAAQVDLLPRSAFIGLLLLTGGSVVLLLSYFITNGYMPGVSLKWPFCLYTNAQFFTVAMCFVIPMCFGRSIHRAIHTVDFARMYYYD
ncbi:hypothetical protein Pmar_PMAR020390 [Perkinsus marinus ATCC 50983]|uniref:Uncharacterized protein n=1 Tax=Perkinsus marinus (strain ATCC 50983 / TXsc) TaxID=423536 RepID=C5L6W9_PERM5|nr:hypothetical protein Pmar_PMAR020390 [Perkinsus marinus ATCC 50983]EER07231.1 hypothetical protein Pmar_PMAR020390 [Perkinsus marinus ATCC 50983]|eukprot:XP_002775415.1 hypothetical protein Pmar_PMAR020390 [Perkinsus marinus ATCC 50983]